MSISKSRSLSAQLQNASLLGNNKTTKRILPGLEKKKIQQQCKARIITPGNLKFKIMIKKKKEQSRARCCASFAVLRGKAAGREEAREPRRSRIFWFGLSVRGFLAVWAVGTWREEEVEEEAAAEASAPRTAPSVSCWNSLLTVLREGGGGAALPAS